jgi:hypothetical protein
MHASEKSFTAYKLLLHKGKIAVWKIKQGTKEARVLIRISE